MAEPELLMPEVARRLATVRADWMVTGSVAAIGHGITRNTHDIDIVIELPSSQVGEMLAAFPPPEFFLQEQVLRESVVNGSLFSVLHNPSGMKIDFWPLKQTPFDTLAFDKRQERMLFGEKTPVIRPEHLILQKLRWAKELGGSERQFGDCLAIYELRAREIDHALLDHWAMRVGVTELLTRLRAEAEPL